MKTANSPDWQPPRDCNICPEWKGMSNPKKGKRIPGGSGKCTWPQGPDTCYPHTVRGQIGGK